MQHIYFQPRARIPQRSQADSPAPRTAEPVWRPAVDIREEADRFVIRVDVPGVDPAAIDITVENGVLSIQGSRGVAAKGAHNPDDNKGYTRTERVRGRFMRNFSLPDTVNTESVAARCQHGVLEVTIPKQEKPQPRRIAVA